MTKSNDCWIEKNHIFWVMVKIFYGILLEINFMPEDNSFDIVKWLKVELFFI